MVQRQWKKKGFVTEDGMKLLALSGASNQDLVDAFPGSTVKSLKKAGSRLAAEIGLRVIAPRSPNIEEMLINPKGKKGIEEYSGGRIVINWDNRTCLTNLGKSLGGNWKTSFDEHNAIQRAYSDMYGRGKTQVEIARTFGFLTVHHVRAYLRAWTIYHSSTPQSPPLELSEPNVDLDGFAEENVAARERALYDKTLKLDWRRTVADAERFRELKLRILEPGTALILEELGNYKVPRLEFPDTETDPFVAVVGLSDVHFGKVSFGPNGEILYDMNIAERELQRTLKDTLDKVMKIGRPDYFVVTMGSDNFHVDNLEGDTTRGTRQDFDTVPDLAIHRYVVAMVRFIDTLRRVNPVKIVVFKGNHDKMSSMWVAEILHSHYRSADDVIVINPTSPRLYLQVGRNCLGFAHGDPEFQTAARQKANIHKLILVEARGQGVHLDKIVHTIFFGGNLHFENTVDYGAVTYEQLVAFCGDDRWHNENVFIGTRKMLATFIIDLAGGISYKLYANASLGYEHEMEAEGKEIKDEREFTA